METLPGIRQSTIYGDRTERFAAGTPRGHGKRLGDPLDRAWWRAQRVSDIGLAIHCCGRFETRGPRQRRAY